MSKDIKQPEEKQLNWSELPKNKQEDIDKYTLQLIRKLQDKKFLKKLFKDREGIPLTGELVENLRQLLNLTMEERKPVAKLITQLLIISCEYNLLDLLKGFLELDITIDDFFSFGHRYLTTLLGVAAYHGHLDIVKYLVKVKKYNVNQMEPGGFSALHMVVYGDSYPFNHFNIGNDHDKVAKYLLEQGARIDTKDDRGVTPYTLTEWSAPFKIERLLGRRIFPKQVLLCICQSFCSS